MIRFIIQNRQCVCAYISCLTWWNKKFLVRYMCTVHTCYTRIFVAFLSVYVHNYVCLSTRPQLTSLPLCNIKYNEYKNKTHVDHIETHCADLFYSNLYFKHRNISYSHLILQNSHGRFYVIVGMIATQQRPTSIRATPLQLLLLEQRTEVLLEVHVPFTQRRRKE